MPHFAAIELLRAQIPAENKILTFRHLLKIL